MTANRPTKGHLPLLAPALTCALGIALSIAAVLGALGLRGNMPAARYDRVATEQWSKAARAIVLSTHQTTDAWNAAVASRLLADAYLGRRDPGQARADLLRITTHMSPPIGRLLQASVTLLEQRAINASPQQTWAAVAALLSGLEHSDYSHHLKQMLDLIAESYHGLGLSRASAYEVAYASFGYAHGPLLEIIAAQLEQLAAERDAAGDANAATVCRQILANLLNRWLHEPGPPGLRLLAADLLASALERGVLTPSNALATAAALRAWRERYRSHAAKLPARLLGLTGGLQSRPDTQTRLVRWVMLTGWLVVATLACGTVAMLGLVWLLISRRSASLSTRHVGIALAGAVLVCLGGVVYPAWANDPVPPDIGRGFPSETLLGYYIAFAASTVLATLAVLAMIPAAGAKTWPTRIFCVSATSWLPLAVAAMASTYIAGRALATHQAAELWAFEHPIEAVAGPDAGILPDIVRDPQ